MNYEPTYTVSLWFRKILVPIDGSENSLRALELATDFSLRYGSKVSVLYVCSTCEDIEHIRKKVDERVGKKIEYEFKVIKIQKESSVSNEILRTVNEDTYDAILLGSRGTSVNSDINIGSVALSVTANASVTVIIVR
ncbi:MULTISPECIES: universal stress protein [Acidianus]|uniref:Universal stress protein UspA n=1 Tax=Candidatus Acidianus copahuensis TaxID=1160895 RepID=A0A031LMR1_9CREN|nr:MULTISPECIES: universal stress protein [Acidianus]EZQ06923.1 universal stress protein UspA [Candidatus Acidianus copahuensis]NON62558.1 universal stress protein [Acidianus sp. RZ1]